MKSNKARLSYEDTPALQKARSHFLNENYSQSLRGFEKEAKRQPNNIMALTDAARAFGQRFEIDKALRYVKRMLSIAGDNAEVLLLAGQSLRMSYRGKEAMECMVKASKMENSPDLCFLEMAVLAERNHDLELSYDSVERYLHRNANSPEALLLKARILRRQKETSSAEEIYQNIYARSSTAEITKAQTLNEWSHLLDEQGDYEKAFSTLLESKKYLSNLPETNTAKERSAYESQWTQKLNESITKEHITRWEQVGSSSKHPTVLLTGCPRSGTTLIEKILDAHSEIISADELNAFAGSILPTLLKEISKSGADHNVSVLENLSLMDIEKEGRRYSRYLSSALNEKIGNRTLIDKNPSLTFHIAASLRVWPQNKILYALRDPRDIAVSCFYRWLPINSVSVRYLTAEDTCKRTSEELKCWLKLREIIPQERWLETRYEDTVENYTKESQKVISWLGLDWEDSISDYKNHLRERGVNSPTYEAVNKPIYKGAIGRWRNYAAHFEQHFPHLQEVIEKLEYD